ncbi:hypothetical protein B0H14DRAFT_700144 [Mycena olivaceomarginata]|nr:hypothetical protein B0H14DRAFT_700144 [Mycena olivaceomarginata]
MDESIRRLRSGRRGAGRRGRARAAGWQPGMTFVDAGGLSTLGVPPTSSGASSALGGGGGAGGGNGGVGKRYRLAPAKTFQCRGYGECRMVFSRSEHLAGHVRHPFSLLPSP